MKNLDEILNNKALFEFETGSDGGSCWRKFHSNKFPAAIIFSWGLGWDHVSMSFRNRVPTWEEMCWLKDAFFDDEEVVVQYHPAKSKYVNCHPNCLHLWKQKDSEFNTPPMLLVGLKG